MKISLTLLLLLTINSSFAQQKETISQLIKLYATAVETKDSISLDKLFSNDMVVVGGNGRIRDKKAELSDLLAPYTVIYFKAIDTLINTWQNTTAIVVGKLNWKLKEGDREVDYQRRFTFVFARFEKEWKIVAQHIGMIR